MKSTPNTLPYSRKPALTCLLPSVEAPASLAGCNGRERRSNNKFLRTLPPAVSGATHAVGLMLHELLGIAELTRIAFEKGELASAHQRLALLIAEATDLSVDIDNILELTRLETEDAKPERVRFDIVALLQEVSQAARLTVNGKPVIVMDVAASSPIGMYSDPLCIKRIMTELMSNAVTFTDRGRVAMILCKDDDTIRLTIADTGRGMTRKQTRVLFEASDYECGGEMNEMGATGLGLRIVKKTVKMLKGTLSASSRVNEGTIVEVSLPLTAESGI